jgi:hypothetical protein
MKYTTIRVSDRNYEYMNDRLYSNKLNSMDDVVSDMRRYILSLEEQIQTLKNNPPGNVIEREVKFAGDKTYINMPREWSGKKVKVIEVK